MSGQHMRILRELSIVLLLCGGVVGCDSGICDADELRSALAGAAAGEVVEVGECRIELGSSVAIADGVTLRGAGPPSVLAGAFDAPVIVLHGDTRGATLSTLTVESRGSKPAVYAAAGTGTPTIANVTITVSRGAGIGAQQLDAINVRDVEVHGPVKLEDIGLLPATVLPTETATQGLVFVEVGRGPGTALLERVRLRGFASNAALFVQSRVIWRGGSAGSGRGSGIYAAGGTLEAEDVDVSEVGQSSGVLYPAAGVVATDGAAVTGTTVSSSDTYSGTGTANNVIGMLVNASTVRLTDSTVARVGSVGLWAQHAPLIEVTGGTFAECSLAGLLGVDSTEVRVSGAAIEMTASVRLTDGREIGDGVEVIGTSTRTRLAALRLAGNARAGVLLDAAGGALDAELTDVLIDGTGTQLGAIAQNGMVPAGWDVGVTRTGAVLANDATFTGVLPVVQTSVLPPPADVSVLVL